MHRKQEDPDDAFAARLLQLGHWARTNARTLIIGGILLAVAVFSLFYYFDYQQTMEASAAEELLNIRQTASSENLPQVTQNLETFLTTFEGTEAAADARIFLAQLYLDTGQPGQVGPVLAPLTDESEDLINASATLLLAAAMEEADSLQRAEELYLQVGESAEFDYQRKEGLEDAARIRLQQGHAAGAVELYDRLIAMVPAESAEHAVYEMRRAEAAAAAGEEPQAAGTSTDS